MWQRAASAGALCALVSWACGDRSLELLSEGSAAPPVADGSDADVLPDGTLDDARSDAPSDACTDGHCPDVVVECDSLDQNCIDCSPPFDCRSPRPYCAGWLAQCQECNDGDDCSSGHECDPLTKRCVDGCNENDDCTSGDKRLCDTNRNVCVECVVDSHCVSSDESCRLGYCVECWWHTDCPESEPYCSVPRMECEECLNDDHCDDDEYCEDRGVCRSIN